MDPRHRLLVGDRLPDFRRHDSNDQPFELHKDACAQAMVLVLVSDPEAQGLDAELSALDGIGDRASVLAMIEGDPSTAARFQQDHPSPAKVLADDGAVMQFLQAGETPIALSALVLDRAHRLLARLQPGESTLAQQALAVLDRHALPEGRAVGAQAPVLVVPKVFEPDFCRHLIEVFETGGNEPSGVLRVEGGKMVYAADRETKIRREHVVKDPELDRAISERLQRRVLPHIQWAFNYQVTRYEGIKVVLYDSSEGGYFRAHRDNDGPDTAHRRFAMTLNLNAEEYGGGELCFPEFSNDRYKPPSGDAVVFSCALAHEALPVTAGRRYALVSFFFSERERIQPVDFENRVTPPTTPRPNWS